MDNSDIGESSCRRKPSNDKMSDSERPLKKAKFAWQVKGRYHLKDQEEVSDCNIQENISQNDSAPIASDEIIDSTSADDTEITSKAEENLEILGDYLLKQQDFSINPLVISATESAVVCETSEIPQDSADSSGTKVSPAEVPRDVKVPVRNYNVDIGLAQSTSHRPLSEDLIYDSDRWPLSMGNTKLIKTEDQYLARWQARQIAKGFVDNTINRVLDSWLVSPLPRTQGDHHSIVLDVAEFFDNLPANNAVENEGILMAISAHGLQNNQSGSHSNESRLQNRPFSPRICTIGLVEPNLQRASESPDRLSEETQYIFSTDRDDNEPSIFSSLSNTESSTTTSVSNSNDNLEQLDLQNDKFEPVTNRKRNETPPDNTSSSSPNWRHLPQPCSCSHTPRRSNITPNIPFHRRDTLEQTQHASPPLEDNISVHKEVSHNTLPSESKKDDSLTDEKSSDDSVNEDYCPTPVNSSSSSLYPIPNHNDQPFDEHFDFMDAAVSFAIQNKGLTSFSSVDYG